VIHRDPDRQLFARSRFFEEYCDTIERHAGHRRPGAVIAVPKISVEVPEELLADLDDHVGDDGKFVNRSDAIRASIRKTLDVLDEIDARHGRLTDEPTGRDAVADREEPAGGDVEGDDG
jgi:Arc/MetJ-type ribon-helix-helix transcriptional regulator